MLTAIKKIIDACFAPDKFDQASCIADFRALVGLEVMRYTNGLISSLKDTHGRHWSFTYAGGSVVRYTDPAGATWCEENGRWHGFDSHGEAIRSKAPTGIAVDQDSGEVVVHNSGKKTVFKTDGTTCSLYDEERQGKTVQMCVTEHSTIPSRTKVAIEKSQDDSPDLLRWIEDANGRVYRFEYDGTKLISYSDISPTTARKWKAEYEGERLVRWIAADSSQVMSPHLESIDLRGNRYFRTPEGRTFVVKPNGAAYAQQAVPAL